MAKRKTETTKSAEPKLSADEAKKMLAECQTMEQFAIVATQIKSAGGLNLEHKVAIKQAELIDG